MTRKVFKEILNFYDDHIIDDSNELEDLIIAYFGPDTLITDLNEHAFKVQTDYISIENLPELVHILMAFYKIYDSEK